MNARRQTRVMALGFCVALGAAVAATNPVPAPPLPALTLDPPDNVSFKTAFAELREKYPAEAAAQLPAKFALEVKFGEQSEAGRTLEAIVARARATRNPDDLVDSVYLGIRKSVPPACGATPFAAKKYLTAEFLRGRSAFVPLIVRAADAAMEITPDSSRCLTAKAEAALLTGDLKLAAECTRKTVAKMTHSAARTNTLRYLEELEKAAEIESQKKTR
jgi:hypothetical protein